MKKEYIQPQIHCHKLYMHQMIAQTVPVGSDDTDDKPLAKKHFLDLSNDDDLNDDFDK